MERNVIKCCLIAFSFMFSLALQFLRAVGKARTQTLELIRESMKLVRESIKTIENLKVQNKNKKVNVFGWPTKMSKSLT